MGYRRLFLAVVCLAALATAMNAWGKENLKKRATYELKSIALVGGELILKAAGDDAWRLTTSWRVRQTPQGTLIYLEGKHEVNDGWSGWYLNYDHKGKDGRLGLVPEPGPGCYWKWKEGGWKRQGIEGYDFDCTARPVYGPMRGWRLALKDDRLVLTNETAEEVPFHGWVDNLDDGK
jgi:hypothetical protein